MNMDIDQRGGLKKWLRGGPVWTTRARIVLWLPIMVVGTFITALIYAIGSFFEHLCELTIQYLESFRISWLECNDEAFRRKQHLPPAPPPRAQ